MSHIVVVDYGMGNLRSVAKALEHVAPDQRIEVSGDPARVAAADRVVFPGQGAMPDCMREIDARGLRPALIDAARSKPFLGLCIGLQLLFEHSEEGDTPGLGILPGQVRRLDPEGRTGSDGARLKVPHMGWNQVHPSRAHPVWDGLPDGTRFYFVHSYVVEPSDPGLSVGSSAYPDPFCCAVARDRLFAVQFHPEKSAQAGLKLLSNFLSWNP
ncbi:MAG: imidazole glycerol phosphate synthase subunit HisH [Pseudomonadota bacterium]|nr:imidazole glycerol phosphate synthase subunit HisH [Pseudomonadota bacterium]